MRDAFQQQILSAGLRGVDVKVAIAISLRLNRNDYEEEGRLYAFPGIDTIAEMIQAPERSVKRSIDRLIKLGHLSIDPGGRGPGDPHHYYPRIKDRYEWVPGITAKRVSRVTKKGVTGVPLISDETLTKKLGKAEDRALAGFDDFERFPGPERLQ
jgi:hypothetical protein